MLALKLLLVPLFLLLVSLAGRRWGAATAGWLAGLPVVTGPILFFIAREQGSAFAAVAATSALGAVFCALCFSLVYAHAAQRGSWLRAWCAAFLAWVCAAALAWALPATLLVQGGLAAVGLIIAPRFYPTRLASAEIVTKPMRAELLWRMLAGASLCWLVTSAASTLGTSVSGLLSAFPVLASVLAVFTHRGQGAAKVAVLLAAMARGLYALATFCLCIALTLQRTDLAIAFLVAVALTLVCQWASKR